MNEDASSILSDQRVRVWQGRQPLQYCGRARAWKHDTSCGCRPGDARKSQHHQARMQWFGSSSILQQPASCGKAGTVSRLKIWQVVAPVTRTSGQPACRSMFSDDSARIPMMPCARR